MGSVEFRLISSFSSAAATPRCRRLAVRKRFGTVRLFTLFIGNMPIKDSISCCVFFPFSSPFSFAPVLFLADTLILTTYYSNMTTSDWSPDDPIASMEPSSDLFDGDILGDELIDIYNAAVVGGGDDDDAMNGKCCLVCVWLWSSLC
jgi:hypothetical protein